MDLSEGGGLEDLRQIQEYLLDNKNVVFNV